MTIEQIEEYAAVYAPAYPVDPNIKDYKGKIKNIDSPWNKNPLTRKEMMKKTVLKILLRKTAPLNPVVSRLLMQFDEEQKDDAAFGEITIKGTDEREKLPRGQCLDDLGFGKNPDPVQEDHWNEWLALCEKADTLGVEHPNPVKDKITDDDLAMGFGELLEYVNAVKAEIDKAMIKVPVEDPTTGAVKMVVKIRDDITKEQLTEIMQSIRGLNAGMQAYQNILGIFAWEGEIGQETIEDSYLEDIRLRDEKGRKGRPWGTARISLSEPEPIRVRSLRLCASAPLRENKD
jgi:hypothetical protein